MDVSKLYEEWLEKAVGDPDLTSELEAIRGNTEEINERFYKCLEFGTAGLRGIIGAGTNRMNIYTVGQATQGLADFLNSRFENPSAAIGYDSRIKSELFAKEAAKILAANGVKVYLFDELEPTPCLSFAIRKYHTDGGIILTASHNPGKYNGYKCYDRNGYQMTDEEAAQTYAFIQKVDYFSGIKMMDFDEALERGLIKYIGEETVEAFLDEVQKQCVEPEAVKKAGLKVIYTPLNGTGNKPVRKILGRIGVNSVFVVPQQELPDGNFPTCPYPNPEIKQAFECALEMTEDIKADILLATDPDCDRVGIAVPDKNGEYVLMSGNEVGAMLLNYLLSRKKAKGTLPENAVAVKSFVSTDLAEKIAQKYGCSFKNVLTGFKYIGEFITKLEAQGRENEFIMGFEESYGYLAGTHARDKDAVVASMLICEMATYYKTLGKSLVEVMDDIYKEYGYYKNIVKSYQFDGAAGMEKMERIMENLRSAPPTEISGLKILFFDDYKTGVSENTQTGEKQAIDLPKSNVLSFKLEDGNGLIVRPSGTEPKIKAYVTAVGGNMNAAMELADRLLKIADTYMEA